MIFIGLRCPTSSLELFYVVEVLDKGEALTDIETQSSCIYAGERFLRVRYLEKSHESSRSVQYRISNFFPPVYVNLAEVFTTNIELNDKMQMNINEYRSISSQLY